MIALAAAAAAAFAPAPRPAPTHAARATKTTPANAVLAPPAVLARYAAALAALKEPRAFAFEYTVEQTGMRTLDQTHRVFRSGRDERDETIAVNGARSPRPIVRIFRGRPYRYGVAALAPKPGAYDFAYTGPHRDGKHVDYVFALAPKPGKAPAFRLTQLIVDGVTFLPQSVSFATAQHAGRGSVTFVKAQTWWVARTASAEANVAGGVARETLAFRSWRFPQSLPPSTFSLPRPLPSAPPALP